MKNFYNANKKTFAQDVFDDAKMKRYLPPRTYRAMLCARRNYAEPSAKDKQIYARAVIKWAVRKGATHYTHWFIPLNGGMAQKKESIALPDINGSATICFGEKELCIGEGDASSFPNGGMRRTFEARGITKWDYTAYAFVSDNCLYIPCTFASFGGEALDKKSPLTASCKALNTQALRLLNMMGYSYKSVNSAVGAEQEYFIVDGKLYNMRKDLVYTGATLFGAPTPQDQRYYGHYLAPLNGITSQFMAEVYAKLWKLGIVAKTQHNEVAPRQCELAPCYANADIAANNDQLIMLTLKTVAQKHGLMCLLHEKPFAYVNGSGKHNNWSLFADGTENLLQPGQTAAQNARFLLFIAAIIKAVDDYGELLSASVCSQSNDCRLGGCEAPPQILSVFVGQPLARAINYACGGKWRCGTDVLPSISAATDRNRTSPFAFTGNKFEFRTVGASACIADVNTVLNTAIAESIRQFADTLEGAPDVWQCAGRIIADTFTQHKRIIFNGDNYGTDWLAEAQNRNLKAANTLQCIAAMTQAHNINLFERHGVLSHREVTARQQIKFAEYCNDVKTSATVAAQIVTRQILPTINQAVTQQLRCAQLKTDAALNAADNVRAAQKLAALHTACRKACALLQKNLRAMPNDKDIYAQAQYCRDVLLPSVACLRKYTDCAETLCPHDMWPMPTYGQLLFDET